MAHPNRKGTFLEPTEEPSETRGSRLAKDWTLPEDWLVWAVGKQPTWSPAHAMNVAEQFRDYWVAVPGAKGRKSDWEATWRNWVRREGAAGGQARKPQQQSFSDVDYRKGLSDDGGF